ASAARGWRRDRPPVHRPGHAERAERPPAGGGGRAGPAGYPRTLHLGLSELGRQAGGGVRPAGTSAAEALQEKAAGREGARDPRRPVGQTRGLQRQRRPLSRPVGPPPATNRYSWSPRGG